jgi:hypothetical protein
MHQHVILIPYRVTTNMVAPVGGYITYCYGDKGAGSDTLNPEPAPDSGCANIVE